MRTKDFVGAALIDAAIALLIGLFAGWKVALVVFTLIALAFLIFIGMMSLGPFGFIAVNGVRRKYDPKDRPGETVFYGPSNFTFWTEMENDLAPFRVQNHGIGGTTDSIMMKFAQQLAFDYKPFAVFFQTGSNDYAMGCSVEDVKRNKDRMYKMFRDALPDARLCVMAGLFIPGRPEYWPQIQEVNEYLEELCAQHENMIFIDGNGPLRHEDGSGVLELYRDDKIHLNHDGQLAWGASMLPVLEQINAPRNA